ncbi:Mu transposase C-terminal domain-containing protein [Pelobacter propionicus]|nr:Mu transposase C-terminal domain-containing protein [Pelobacter propionicus]
MALIKKAIQRGKFESARQVTATQEDGRPLGRGGKIWQINIADPAVPVAIRIKWFDIMLAVPEQPSLPAVAAANLPVVAPKSLTVPDTLELNGKQERIITARFQLLLMLENRGPGKKVMQAAREIIDAINDCADKRLVNIAKVANDRKGTERGLSLRTLMRWWNTYQKTGRKQNALAPVKGDRMPRNDLVEWLRDYAPGTAEHTALPVCVPSWVPYFLDEYRRPQKPSMQEAWRQISRTMPPDIARPSYDQVRRVMKKVPVVHSEKGRRTGAEYNSLLGYVERDASGFAPMSICQIDGHSFKAYVAHPVTGAHFHPEICGVICMTTKVLAGWSAGLAESNQTVGDAYRHACTVNENKPWGGVPAILEADRGAGNMAKVNSDDYIGLFARIGTTFIPPKRGGNPQGHGAIERSNQTIWIRAAKSLVTCTTKDMDRGARRKVYDRLEADLKEVKKAGKLGMVPKTSDLLMSWPEFLEFLDRVALEYNSTPHKALQKIVASLPDNPDGPAVSRHMSPFECWADYVAQGFEPVHPDDVMLHKLFAPHATVTVKRQKFTLNGNSYHSHELDEYHGQQVVVSYDINNAHTVTVFDADENFICEARWNGNRVHARPVPEVEQATMQRHSRRVKNKEKQLDMMNAELDRKTLEIRPLVMELDQATIDYEAREEQKRQAQLAAPKYFKDEHEFYNDVRERQREGLASAYETQWADDKDASYTGRGHVGLFKSDRYCEGRFKPENKLQPMEKAAGATNTSGL